LHRIASRTHKWLAIVIGVQLLFWFASGTLMSFLPIETVRGEHLVDRTTVAPIPATMILAPPAVLTKSAGGAVTSLTYRMSLGQAIAELTTPKGVRLADATTGAMLPPTTAAQAEAIARAAWRGDDRPAARVERVERGTADYRGALPAWRVAFADAEDTSVFVAADTARITAVRTGTWRLYDFFWGLHIMDWKNHENFNTPWLLAFAVGGLLLWIGGAVLLWMRWPGRRRTRPD
jgi:hypothetical protein